MRLPLIRSQASVWPKVSLFPGAPFPRGLPSWPCEGGSGPVTWPSASFLSPPHGGQEWGACCVHSPSPPRGWEWRLSCRSRPRSSRDPACLWALTRHLCPRLGVSRVLGRPLWPGGGPSLLPRTSLHTTAPPGVPHGVTSGRRCSRARPFLPALWSPRGEGRPALRLPPLNRNFRTRIGRCHGRWFLSRGALPRTALPPCVLSSFPSLRPQSVRRPGAGEGAPLRPDEVSSSVTPNDPVTNICQAADKQLFTLVEWAKRIPHFSELPLDDQVILLRAGWNELLIASFSHRSIAVKDGILLATGLHVHRNSAHSAGVGAIFDRVLTELVSKMRDMQMDKTELGCLRAIVLFNPDSKGLSNPAEVEALREKVYASLEAYCKHKYPEQPGRFAKLLLRLPALRSIGLKCLEHLFFFKLIGDTPIDTFLMEMLEAPHQMT
ncbi:retinoic acid receptor RXR-alpha isoform X9 [Ursus arctos]|uniref:retinoic acid receptor RXR-alpha isoform X9 n=1 Tax=Ursus arctos TaxID=9644 RepID=UPI002546EB2E|nr:retinoic acid receptor RXR-alpha isoform X9 [Ursus arctos]